MVQLRFVLKPLLLVTFMFLSIQHGMAQLTLAEIGVNGLTCSQCSRSVEMSLRKLDFVLDVEMSLANTTGIITFRKDTEINLKKIAKAVTDAGFSVDYLKIAYSFSSVDTKNTMSLNNVSGKFCFVNTTPEKLHGEILLTVINKEFMPKQEYKKWKDVIKKSCEEISQNTYYIAL